MMKYIAIEGENVETHNVNNTIIHTSEEPDKEKLLIELQELKRRLFTLENEIAQSKVQEGGQI